jgi:hypothetical protein
VLLSTLTHFPFKSLVKESFLQLKDRATRNRIIRKDIFLMVLSD